MHRKLSILILFSLGLYCFLGGGCMAVKPVPRAIEGVLDLSQWDFKRDGPIDLNGEWEFYWQKHRVPDQIPAADHRQKRHFSSVPGSWNNLRIDGEQLGGEGYATYRLKVILAKKDARLAFKFLDMATAFAFFVNDRELLESGVTGKTRASTVPQFYPRMVEFAPAADTLEITLIVSNFHHRLGGAWEAITLGGVEDIQNIRDRSVMLGMFLFGSIFIMGLYHFGLYGLRRDEKSTLYFGIFCLLIVLRLLTTGERFLIQFWPDFSWELLTKMVYVSFYLAIPFFALFVKTLFPHETSRKGVNLILLVAGTFALGVLVTSARFYTRTMPLFQILTVLAFLYGFYALGRATLKRREGAIIFMLGFIILFAAALNDILYSRQFIQTTYLIPAGLFVFIFSQAFLLSLRFSKAFHMVEIQRGELRVANAANLQEIKERKRAEADLKQRLIYEQMLSEISTRAATQGDINDFQDRCLHIIGKTIDVSRIYIFEYDRATKTVSNTHEWINAQEQERLGLGVIPIDAFPWWDEMMERQEIINYSDIEKMPGVQEKELLRSQNIKSILVVPLFVEKSFYGFIGFEECRKHREWRSEDVNMLKTTAHILTRAIEARQAEKRLVESEKKYRALFEDSLEAMSLTQNGRIVDANPAWLQLHGVGQKGSVLGRSVFDFIHPDDHQILAERRRRWPHIAERKYRLRDVRQDGTAIDVEVYSSGTSLGGQDAVLATVHDITAIKRAAEEKKQLEARLQRVQKMEVIGTLAGGVAHDLNNILSGLVSYPELLLMEIPPDSPLKNPILTIKKSGERAAAIVQDLLTLARRAVVVNDVLNLNAIVTEYLKSPEHEKLKTFHPQVAIQADLQENLLNLAGSPIHLAKTLMNLVANAAEAMPLGGDIKIATANLYIDRPVEGYDHVDEGDYVVLRVSDTGIGLAEKDKERIFEPFYTKKIMGRSGTGLGMAVVWGTVKDHKGYIDIQSKEGEGTTFTLYFPVTRKELPQEPVPLSLADYMGRGELILVVDDVALQRKLAAELLKKLGYSVATVSGGEEAVEFVSQKAVDLIILDMIMDPGIDGLETYRRILKKVPGQRAIIVSGFSETAKVKAAKQLGAGKYVQKPYTMEKIARAVKNELTAIRRG